jgi:hypothetical protein
MRHIPTHRENILILLASILIHPQAQEIIFDTLDYIKTITDDDARLVAAHQLWQSIITIYETELPENFPSGKLKIAIFHDILEDVTNGRKSCQI